MNEMIQKHTVVCDNPTCDYKVVNTTGTVDINDLKSYVNKPCSQCGENLLTEKDYNDAVRLVKIVVGLNKYFGWWFKLFPRKQTKTVSIHVHNGLNTVNQKD